MRRAANREQATGGRTRTEERAWVRESAALQDQHDAPDGHRQGCHLADAVAVRDQLF